MNSSPIEERRWFHARGKEKVGPLSLDELRRLMTEGGLAPTDMLLPTDAARWLPAREVPGLFVAAEPTVDEAPRTVAYVDPTPPSASAPGGVPGYDILGELGRGGMGVVYKARQVGLNRLVALKMILSGEHAGDMERARFVTEGQAIARLQHPNIVQIHEVGDHDGRPFFSLEYCDGGSLAQRLGGVPLPASEAAALVEQLARAMGVAHEAGIVHRDLKPGNVLLAATPPAPKVTDFGLARKLGDSNQTQSGAILGTPSYMAPEQAEGRTHDVGPGADIWALGAILYECLTGRPPFRGATPVETIDLVRTREPVPPRQLTPATPRDLETICLKCLQKDPARRYLSAPELADDLKRFLAGEPIRARPVGRLERAWRWSKRNPALAALSVLLLVSVVAGFVGIELKRREAEANAETARTRETEANHAKQLAEERERQGRRFIYATLMNQAAEAWKRGDLNSLERYLMDVAPRDGQENLCGIEWHYYWNLMHGSRLTLFGHTGTITSLAYSPDGALLASTARDSTVRLWDAATGKLRWSVPLGNFPDNATFSPDGTRLAATYSKDTIAILDVRDGRLLHKGGAAAVHALAWSPDGKALAVGRDEGILEFRTSTVDQVLLTIPNAHASWVSSLAFTADGKHLFTLGGDAAMRLWQVDGTWKADSVRKKSESETPYLYARSRLSVSTNGEYVVAVGRDRRTHFWNVDPRTGKFVHVRSLGSSHNETHAVALARDDGVLLSVGEDRVLRSWDHTGKPRPSQAGHALPPRVLAVAPGGDTVASGGDDGVIKVWSVDDKAGPREVSALNAVAFSPAEDLLATGGADGHVRLWDAVTGKRRDGGWPNGPAVHALAFTPDGKTLISGDAEGMIHLRHLSDKRTDLLQIPESVRCLAVAPDGRQLAVGGDRGRVQVFELPSGKNVLDIRDHHDRIAALAYSPDGKLVAAASWDYTLHIYEPARLSRAPRRNHFGRVLSVAFTPDGNKLLTSCEDGYVRLTDVNAEIPPQIIHYSYFPLTSLAAPRDCRSLYWVGEYATGTLLENWTEVALPRFQSRRTFPPVTAKPRTLALSRDGKRLALGTADGTLTLWEVGKENAALVLPGHRHTAAALACSADGKAMAVEARNDFAVRLYDEETKTERAVLRGHTHPLTALAFAPDSRLLASAAHDRTVRLWDGTTGAARGVLKSPDQPIRCLTFSADGRTLVTGSGLLDTTSELLLWDVATGTVRRKLEGHRWAIHAVSLSPDGKLLATVGGSEWAFPGEVRLWDMTAEKPLATLIGHRDLVTRLAFAPDGKTLATAGRDGGVHLWDIGDVRSPVLRSVLQGHQDEVTALVYAPDGRTLISAGKDRTLRFWHPELEQPLGVVAQDVVVWSLAFGPKSGTLYRGDESGEVVELKHIPADHIEQTRRRRGEAIRTLDLSAESVRISAAARRHTAEQQVALGRRHEAIAALRDSATQLGELANRHPDESAFALDQAATLTQLAELLLTDQRDAAVQACRECVQLLTRHDSTTQQDQYAVVLRLRALTYLLEAALAERRWPDAERLAEELTAARPRLAERGDVTPYLDDLVRVSRCLGELHALRERKTQAQGEYRSAIDWLGRLRLQRGTEDRHWREVIDLLETRERLRVDEGEERLNTLLHLASVSLRRQQALPWDAERLEHTARTYRKLAEHMDALGRKDAWYYYYSAAGFWIGLRTLGPPAWLDPYTEHADAMLNYFRLFAPRGSHEAIKSGTRRALVALEMARAKAPDNQRVRQLQARVLVYRAEACAQLGEADEAVAAVRQRLELPPLTPTELRWGAGILARAAEKKGEHAEAALRLLERAVKEGYRDAADLETAQELAPLRKRDAFRKLLDDLKRMR